MSGYSHEVALRKSGEELAQLIAELHELRVLVRRAEAANRAKGLGAASQPQSVGYCNAQPPGNDGSGTAERLAKT